MNTILFILINFFVIGLIYPEVETSIETKMLISLSGNVKEAEVLLKETLRYKTVENCVEEFLKILPTDIRMKKICCYKYNTI